MEDKKVHKQAFWFTLINYLGVAIGVVSTVFIYPNDKEFFGIVRYVDSIAQMFYPLMIFGGAQTLIHFYPALTEHNKKQLFKYGIVTIVVVSSMMLGIILLLKPFIDWENYKYLFYAFPIGFVFAFIELFKRQATNIEKLAVPTFYEKIIPKVSLPIVFWLLLFGYLDVINALLVFIFSYLILLILLAFYVFKHYKINSGYNFNSLFSEVSKREYYRYSFYAFLGSFGSLLAFRIDAFMIPEFLTFEDNGTYNIGVAIATSLTIPATGLFAIYAPKVSAYLKDGNMSELASKYRETAKLLFFIGAILYTSIVLGVDSFFKMLPTYDKLAGSIPVITLLGLNVLINMATGFNSEIIAYSKYYRINIISVLMLAILNIVLNFYFLTQTNLGIIGVAYSSLIAMLGFNAFKLIFIYRKLRMIPFDIQYLKLFITVGLVFLVCYLLPTNPNNMFNLIIKAGLNMFVLVFVTYKMKWIFSLNYWIDKLFKLGKQ